MTSMRPLHIVLFMVYLSVLIATLIISPHHAIGTLIWAAVSMAMTHTLIRSLREGTIRFLQGNGVRRDQSPKRYWAWIRYGGTFWLLFNALFGYAWWKALSHQL